MKTNVKISIIIPVYNANKYVGKCIDSILNQTFKDFELLLIDAGSTDNSLEICNNYKEKDDRIKVFHKENGGQGSARNYGIKKAKGEYVAFVDNDDTIHPQMYELLYNAAYNNNADIVYCNFINIYNNKYPEIKYYNYPKVNISEKTKDDIFNEYYAKMDKTIKLVVPWSKLVKKDLYNDIEFPHLKLGEDFYVSSCLYLKSSKTIFIDEPLYYFNFNVNSTSRHCFDERYFDDIKALNMNYETYISKGYKKYADLCSLKVFKRLLNINYRIKVESKNHDDYIKFKKQCSKIYKESKKKFFKNISLINKLGIAVLYHLPSLYKLITHNE